MTDFEESCKPLLQKNVFFIFIPLPYRIKYALIKRGIAMRTHYKTRGTCSRSIEFEVTDGVVTHCVFDGGCAGNTQAVGRLVIGRPVEEVIRLLKGIQCRNGTSCPDQLAQALEKEKF